MPENESAKLHTPNELLLGAEKLLNTHEPKFMRSVILESLAALEAYVQITVFTLLDKKMDPLFVKWLKDKTRMDFDSRLNQLTPLALNTPVDMASSLWREYKEAREIRNKVAHHSRVASYDEASQVFETVKKWLSYLGANAEVDLSLIKLKVFLEKRLVGQSINEGEAIEKVIDFYSKSQPFIDAKQESVIKNYSADLVLDFGDYKTLFEIKLSKRRFEESLVQLEHLYSKLHNPDKYRLVLLQFVEGKIPESFEQITQINGYTSVVFIELQSQPISDL